MLLHREYLVYRSMRFLVSFEGEPGKGTEDSQNLRMTILSATPGKPRDLETKEIAGTIDEAKHQIRDSLSSEDGHGQWERFMLRPEPDGTFSGPGFLAETMMPLVYKYGVEGLRERLNVNQKLLRFAADLTTGWTTQLQS